MINSLFRKTKYLTLQQVAIMQESKLRSKGGVAWILDKITTGMTIIFTAQTLVKLSECLKRLLSNAKQKSENITTTTRILPGNQIYSSSSCTII